MSVKDMDKEVILLWGVRDKSEIIRKGEFKEYSTILKGFKFIPVLSDDNTYEGEKGFIDTDKIQKHVENVLDYDFYICGPLL